MRTPHFVRLMLGVGLLAGGVAVAASSEPVISVKLPQQSYNVKLTGKDITAPHIQLSHSRKEMRGRIFDAVAVLSFKGDEVTGNIGGGAVNLKARMEGDTLKAEGGFGGSPAEVSYNAKELTVYLRSCTYRLKSSEETGTYVGRRSCDRVFERETVVQVPEVLKELSPVEQATVLLLSL